MMWFWGVYLGIPITLICTCPPTDNPIRDKYESGEWSLARAWFCLGLVIVLWPILLLTITMKGGE